MLEQNLLEGKIKSNGGRVLNITAVGNSFFEIRKKIISIIKKINWKMVFIEKTSDGK